MALTGRIIVSPSKNTREVLQRRMGFARTAQDADALATLDWGAVLIVQGNIPELFCALDVATKTTPVVATEIVGNCPQNIVSMAFVGRTADVQQALAALKAEGLIG